VKKSFASIENLRKLKAYVKARELGKIVWDIVSKWSIFAKRTVGEQWVRSTDSISANIAEGYGAYFYLSSIKFYYYARRSLFEHNDWFSKAIERKLVTKEEIEKIRKTKKDLPYEINVLIKRVKKNKDKNKQINK